MRREADGKRLSVILSDNPTPAWAWAAAVLGVGRGSGLPLAPRAVLFNHGRLTAAIKL